MKKLVISIFVIISILFVSCNEKSNAISQGEEPYTVEGTINNWSYGSNHTILFNGHLLSKVDSTFNVDYFSISKISETGNFKFKDILTPSESIFRYDFIYGLYPLSNRGIFADTIHPFIHDYAVTNCITYTPEMRPQGNLYAGNTDKGYSAFIRPENPVGTYSVIFEYVDRNYTSHFSKSQFQDGYYVTWEYNLYLKKGWNVIYIKQARKTENTMLITLDQQQPDSPYQWHLYYFYEGLHLSPNSHRDRVTGRVLE